MNLTTLAITLIFTCSVHCSKQVADTFGSYLLPDGVLRNVARTPEGGTCTSLTTGNDCIYLINGLTFSEDNMMGVHNWALSEVLEFKFIGHDTNLVEMVIYQGWPAKIKDILLTINGVETQIELIEDVNPQRYELDIQLATNAKLQLLTMYGGSGAQKLVEVQFLSKENNPRFPAETPINVAGRLYGGQVYSTTPDTTSFVDLIIDDITWMVRPFYWFPHPFATRLAHARFDFHTMSRIQQVRLMYWGTDVPMVISFDSRNFTEVLLPRLENDEFYDINIDINTVSDYMVMVFNNSASIGEVMVYGYHEPGAGDHILSSRSQHTPGTKTEQKLTQIHPKSLDIKHQDKANTNSKKPHRSLLKKQQQHD